MISYDFFFYISLQHAPVGHVTAIFGNHVTTATNWSDSEEIMASKVGVPPFKGHVSENLSMLKVSKCVKLVV